MNTEMLLAEGRRLVRPCVFLQPEASGPVAAIWHTCDDDEIQKSGMRCWITVDTSFVPGFPEGGPPFMTIFTDAISREGGRIEYSTRRPTRKGIELRSSPQSILPPIEAVFARGSEEIAAWLASHDWPRDERYNDNFPDRAIVAEYEREWFENYPIYRQEEIHAVLGGWHWPCADEDWYKLIDEQLMVFTIEDSEPWVEAWHLRNGQDHLVQRIT